MPDNYVKKFQMKAEEEGKEIIRDANSDILKMAKAVSKRREIKRNF
mgnify:FL=1